MHRLTTPKARLSLLFGGTIAAWLILTALAAAGRASAAGSAVALGINLLTFLIGIWSPPQPWPPDWPRRVALAFGALISAFSWFVIAFIWAWSGAHDNRSVSVMPNSAAKRVAQIGGRTPRSSWRGPASARRFRAAISGTTMSSNFGTRNWPRS